MAEFTSNETEHEHISTSLEVEQLDTNLFRSKSLWLPMRARGVYGGQVISQALVSATKCVDSAYSLHSLHCYFILSVSPAKSVLYNVDRIRDGRSYVTRSVRAVQNGRTVFVMLCSFQKPELSQPSYQWPMPANVPDPEACDPPETYHELAMNNKNLDPKMREYSMEYIEERKTSPIAIRLAGTRSFRDGLDMVMYWFKARNAPKYDVAFQKCILSYISDSHFIGIVRRIHGLVSLKSGGSNVGMTTSLDHTIWFYDDKFDCGDWILHVMLSPRAGSGRGVVHGRMYSRDGTLVAVTSQEGVVRTAVQATPDKPKL